MAAVQSAGKPDVTIIICTYNRAPMFRLALESLITQNTQGQFSFEVVIVDDRSSDETPQIAEEFIARSPVPMRYFREEGRGVAVARNRGLAEAQGEWIAYTDDDQWNEPDWLYELMGAARKEKVLSVGGIVALQLPPEATLPLTPVTSAILGQKINPEGPITSLMNCPQNGNVMFHRSVFDRVGVYDNELHWGGEDAELMLRVMLAGITIWFNPRALVHHMIPPYRVSEEYFRWASLRVGIALADVDARARGKVSMLARCVARIGQALLVNVPRLIMASIAGDKGKVIETKCLLWRATTYVRHVVRIVAPKLFPQEKFFRSLEFRGERTTLGAKK